jgi:hypothetical protein
VPNPSQTLLITSAERKQKNERECKGGKACCELRQFLTGVAEPIDPLALFIYIYISVFVFFCFFHTGGANWGKPREEKKILQARWLLARRGVAGAAFCLGRSQSYQNGTRAAIAGRVAESVSVSVATRAKRRLFSLFFSTSERWQQEKPKGGG